MMLKGPEGKTPMTEPLDDARGELLALADEIKRERMFYIASPFHIGLLQRAEDALRRAASVSDRVPVPPPSEAGRDLIEGGITAFIASIPTDAEMRAATIEECAKVADDLALWFGARQVFLAEDAVDDCARKIRALSPDPGAVP